MDKTVETANGPLGLSGAKQGNGRTNPTQNLVDAFFNEKDGHFINDKGKYEYNEQLPYAQRDPRLEYTINTQWFVMGELYDGNMAGVEPIILLVRRTRSRVITCASLWVISKQPTNIKTHNTTG